MSILLHGCTTWTLTKRTEKKLDGYFTRMLRAILKKSWKPNSTKHHLPPISKTTQIRRTRHAGHYWRSKNELISVVLRWTPLNKWAGIGCPAWTYLQQLCKDTRCSLEDLPNLLDDRVKWWGRVREINARGTTWYIHIYIVIYRQTVSLYHTSSVWLNT